VTSVLKKSIRNYDEICRYGGDELLLILPNCTAAETESIAERLRQNVTEHTIKSDTVNLNVTLSFGGASSESYRSGVTPNALILAADEALLEAKNKGRNCVVSKNFKGKDVNQNVRHG
jgi:diguanylate cyclase (GGDEF)-like protein